MTRELSGTLRWPSALVKSGGVESPVMLPSIHSNPMTAIMGAIHPFSLPEQDTARDTEVYLLISIEPVLVFDLFAVTGRRDGIREISAAMYLATK